MTAEQQSFIVISGYVFATLVWAAILLQQWSERRSDRKSAANARQPS